MSEKKKNRVLVLKNKYLIFLYNSLDALNLHGVVSRHRSRFLKLIYDRALERNKMLEEISKKYADKDKKGEPKKEEVKDLKTGEVQKDSKGQPMTQYVISEENREKADKEWEEYMEEEYKIDVMESNRDIIYGTRDLYLKTTTDYNREEAKVYDELCEAFENI